MATRREQARREWQQFRVAARPAEGRFDYACRPLDEVAHVTHLRGAMSIADEGVLRAGLVFDESRLNNLRILVAWLSPNDWTDNQGFRYGNNRFTFRWSEIIQGRTPYWVEPMAYGRKAARILLSAHDRSNLLEPYRPEARDGPWWNPQGTDEHWWNGNYTLEIMLEDDVQLSDAIRFDFVDHHPTYCSNDWHTCGERGHRSQRGGASFIAAAVGRGVALGDLPCVQVQGDQRVPSRALIAAARSCIAGVVNQVRDFRGSLDGRGASSRAFARALLNARASARDDEAALIGRRFSDRAALERALRRVISEAFALTSASSLRVEQHEDEAEE